MIAERLIYPPPADATRMLADANGYARAMLNILEDAASESERLADSQRAMMNILEDVGADAGRLGDTQRAVLNILDDVDLERNNTERANVSLREQVIERERTAASLRQANVEAATANRELEAFSYSVAHDLRAPLRSIDGFSQALIEDYDDKLDEGGRTYLRFVRESALHMARLINDLLGLAHIGRAELIAVPADLAAIFRAAAEQLRRAQPDRLIELVAPATVAAFGDPRLLAVVIENLLANAWKFTGKTPSPRIELGQITQDVSVVYFVRDNGVGFDMAYSEKLFAVFQRLHTVGEFEGTGIGLATVQRVILRHGGRIWAEGEVGRGATFYFTLKEAP
jgi:light-regulated signal transduction histidine kinase (bacteriophytochrome)